MTSALGFVERSEDFDELVHTASDSVRIGCMFPDWPFRDEQVRVDCYEFAAIQEASFGQTIARLADHFGDEEVSCLMSEPPPSDFLAANGRFPAFTVRSSSVSDHFDECMSLGWDQGDGVWMSQAPMELIYFGETKDWIVWGRYDWDLAMVAAPGLDRPWIDSGPEPIPADELISEWLGPLRAGLPDEEADLREFEARLRRSCS